MFSRRMFPFRSLATMTLAVALAPPAAFAQSTNVPPEPAAGAPGVTVKWNNGLDVASTDGAHDFQIGGLVQFDGRFTTDDPLHVVTDTFVLRRVRPIFQGRAGKYFEFRLMPDFGNGTTVLFDAYFDTKLSKSFRVRVGKDKTPVGLEQLYPDYGVLFPERTLVTNLVPNRDLGIQAQGDIGGVLSYIGAVFNGVPDAANADIDANSRKDLAGRLTLRPFARTSLPVLKGALVAVGGTNGKQSGTLPSFKSAAQQTFFSYASTATADGTRTRISPAASYYYKSFGAFAEYARTTQAVKSVKAADDITNTAWEVTASFVLTGEAASERGVIPKRPFDPAQNHWGALQLVVRHSRLAVDPLAFTDGFAAANASRTARATGIGASLYANPYVKYVLTFERTIFDDSPNASRRPEHAIVFRLQFNLQPSL